MSTKFWFERLDGKSLLGRPRCTWNDNIKIDLKAVGWKRLDWVHEAGDREQ
jgi:hypothetical protein